MLELPTLVAASGELIEGFLHVSNDGPPLEDVEVDIRFADTASPVAGKDLVAIEDPLVDLDAVSDRFSESATAARVSRLDGHRASRVGPISLGVPDAAGNHDLVVRLRAGDALVSENRYPIHVVDRRPFEGTPPLVIAEGALDAEAGDVARRALERGEVVLVLAQPKEAAPHYPTEVALDDVATTWGSTVFHFTTDHGALPSLPRRNMLVAEDSTVQATSVLSAIDGSAFPECPVVIAFKPVPGAMAGTIVGSHPVGRGRLVVCQYRVTARAAAGDVAAQALLDDLLAWASWPRPVLRREDAVMSDGRAISTYRFVSAVAQ
jgi:hypothetical protein